MTDWIELKVEIGNVPVRLSVKVSKWSSGNPNGDPCDLIDFECEYIAEEIEYLREVQDIAIGCYDSMQDYYEDFNKLEDETIEEWIEQNETLIYNTWTR